MRTAVILNRSFNHDAELSSCFLPIFTFPGLMRYFAKARAIPDTSEQDYAVVVEIADDGHRTPNLSSRLNDLRTGLRGSVGVHRYANQLGPACPARASDSPWT